MRYILRKTPTTILTANPATTLPSSTTTQDTTSAQNDVRAPSDPSTNPANTSTQAKNNVDDADGLDTNDNPEKLEGPGPRPVAEIARENGGDAGKATSSGSVSNNKKAEEAAKEEDENPHSGDKGMLYVRSSGMKADGGDFDATKPGAGKEADREFLLLLLHLIIFFFFSL